MVEMENWRITSTFLNLTLPILPAKPFCNAGVSLFEKRTIVGIAATRTVPNINIARKAKLIKVGSPINGNKCPLVNDCNDGSRLKYIEIIMIKEVTQMRLDSKINCVIKFALVAPITLSIQISLNLP